MIRALMRDKGRVNVRRSIVQYITGDGLRVEDSRTMVK